MNHRSETMLQWCRDHDDCELRCSPNCYAHLHQDRPWRPDPCHANWSDFGKGAKIKAHDWATVPGCRACHDWLDFGGSPDEVKRECFVRGLARWLSRLFLDGRLGPAVDNDAAEDRKQRVASRWKKRSQNSTRTPQAPEGDIPKIVKRGERIV